MLTNGIFIEKHLQHTPPSKSNLSPVFWFLKKISFASKENTKYVELIKNGNNYTIQINSQAKMAKKYLFNIQNAIV